MSSPDEIPEETAYAEMSFDGVVHRVPVTPELARRWLVTKDQALGHGRGEPMVDEDGQLIEHHGLPEDPHAEPAEPTVLGLPLEIEDDADEMP